MKQISKQRAGLSIGKVIAVLIFGLFFVANLMMAIQPSPKANAVFLYEKPSIKEQ